ncbi:carbamoyltransferase HypF [Rubellimicrobium arenae]|uniref:carbamoyltransferase HypF n=1 Tax=Rubellimicrobium arenae TaxID=2817372 RepID=UPI001FEF5F9C|nr:carbamoyltransferase HypF [Rubellimicrobium arenae]
MHGALSGPLAIRVRGQVQGVGFRPFVWQLATRFGLRGEVLNDPEGVLIHVTGDALPAFLDALPKEAPPLARIDAIESAAHVFATEPVAFTIAPSRGVGAETRVTPDAATCPACAAEIRDPTQRRFGYAFTNCTHCGPRLSILSGLPYDRARTAMADFVMCPDCAREYADPADRRFHAQPIACPACGPRLWLEQDGRERLGDPVAHAATLLRDGAILAVKGLGGVHLACDATNPEAIATLRARKRRPTKPFALMAPLATIRAHAEVRPEEEALLSDPAAPVVLLTKAGTPLPDGLAPGQPTLGWMLPYTPLHHLLLDAVDRPLVMTSGNLSGEPQVIANDETRAKLSAFADAFLLHDRDILRRLDDGVERWTPHGPMTLRRGRGRVPTTQPLPPGFESAPPVTAYGGHLKSAICLTKNGQALLSHHLGDLDDALTFEEFLKADADYAALFDHRPHAVACDLHPDARASLHARSRGLPVIEVQHHHAHLAACLGENLWPRRGGPVAGIVLDGLGLGPDGTVWGGELLVGDYADVTRAAHLAPAPLPGGDAAQREPWRNAVMRLDQAGLSDLADRLFPDRPRDLLRRAARAGVNAPLSSSAGRLFDAVAALVGFGDAAQSFEGEAAMRVEALALTAPDAEPYPFAQDGPVIDPVPLIQAIAADLAAGTPPGHIAARFQSGLAQAFCRRARIEVEQGRARAVALTGGCFQNATLLDLCLRELDGLPVLIHRRVPANDGGLALGQALVGAARLAESA